MAESFVNCGRGGHVATFGWDGDRDAAIAYPDGGFHIRDGKGVTVGFEICRNAGRYRWFNAEGYLPCLVTEFAEGRDPASVANFADKVRIGGHDYVIAFSRITCAGAREVGPSPEFVALGESEENDLHFFDYAIAIDRFGQDVPWPSREAIKAAGGRKDHYAHMKSHWTRRLAEIADVRSPDSGLNDAYKAGFVYTHIVKDGFDLNVGENGYDSVWDHDAIGILATQILVGCHREAPELLRALPRGRRFDDAVWKFSWPFAVYLQKTGDRVLAEEFWDQIAETAHRISEDRTGVGRTMKGTEAIDTRGCWTIDDWSALTGLLAYRAIANRLGRREEAAWARREYVDLLDCCNAALADTLARHGIGYIPASLLEPNDANRTKDPADANWAAHFLFGRWAWDGFLMGGEQYGPNLELIDATYDYGFARLRQVGLPAATFGGYPEAWGPMYCSAYNAGYGSAALRGDRHRSAGVRGYRFLVDNCQSGPNSYWENIGAPGESGWEGTHPAQGSGSCPHMWGQSVATKVLLDSIAAEFFDGRLSVGRGVPDEWLDAGPVEVLRFPLSGSRRCDVRIEKAGAVVELELRGDLPTGEVMLDLPLFQGRGLEPSMGHVEGGVVVFPQGTSRASVRVSS